MAATFACRCLNIRIHSERSPTGLTPELLATTSDTGFENIFVPPDGISVTYADLTLDEADETFRLPRASRSVRTATLTCLVCNLATYRIQYEVGSSDADHHSGSSPKESRSALGPFLRPFEGWIQVNKEALTMQSISAAEKDSRYSAIFKIVVPSEDSVSLSLPADYTLSHPSPHVDSWFPERTLFPPPPFSPKHPAFARLASVAEEFSISVRSEVERIIRAKLREVDTVEMELRKHAEIIWKTYNIHLKEMQRMKQVKEASNWTSSQTAQNHEATVAVHEFVPQPASLSKPSVSHRGHKRISSLSASLKTPSPLQPILAPSSSSVTFQSPDPISFTNTPKSKTGPSSVLNIRRAREDDTDIAVSYKVLVLEEARAKHLQSRSESVDTSEPLTQSPAVKSPSEEGTAVPITNGPREKKRRSVKFEVTPLEDRAPVNNDISQEMVFDLEDEDGRYVEPPRPVPVPEDRSITNSRSNRRPARAKQTEAGLPTSYISLRPASLPPPSTIGRVKDSSTNQGTPSKYSMPTQGLPSTTNPQGGGGSDNSSMKRGGSSANNKTDTVNPRTIDRDLYAVPDDTSDSSSALEVGGSPFMVGSLPMPVQSFAKRDIQSELTSASYHPSALNQPSQTLPTGRPLSSRAIKRALYAERDRARSIDPGFFSLLEEEDGDDQDALPELSADQRDEKGDRGKQTALRILQKGAEVPDAGMWRSLAD